MTTDETENTADAAGEAKSPEEIRADIERTRKQLGDTVEALAAKTDVKSQAKSRITAAKVAAQSKRDDYVHRAKQATPQSASDGADQLTATVKEKPLPFAVSAAFMTGVTVGWLLKRPR